MKITNVEVTSSSEPKQHPVRDALQLLDRNGVTSVTITTDEGISGSSRTYFGRLASSPDVLAKIITDQLAPAIIGDDPSLIRMIRDKLWRLTDYQGTGGLSLYGISAIDQALWDLQGKALGVPVWQLLGAQRTSIPTYAMVGWLELDIAELEQVSAHAMEQGFLGVKMKVGGGPLTEDVARISAVRNIIGPDAALMVDANQAFSYAEALRRGRAYEDLGCRWFEEPVPAADTESHVRLAERLDIPIAAGENRYGQLAFRDLIARGGVGVVQPDLRRAGGITDCFEIGLMAAGFSVPYASHGGGAHIHILAALPNTLYMESGLLPSDGSVQLVDGSYPLPIGPGLSSWND
ncbi:mandelate racemase/muconate lactonizing enzyme family protein [Microlunatus sp. Gsoil 973]|jgi:L-alanine-DL-glutamate epimerase-like enolase superfamily enzyme|uniref:mandelate racemase/muconate lactonizing enzyme family protein n=1 Tax=Microlunatus sp. Gsoil 973 TaxID=2672569 RepID=UPI0012B44BE6|nr:mandelate racemase/muconate lactonizing enzyme family protein [Microlunatus sp. Gsoil 973]QGN33688.1 mandelate racemase/muconate lactonizing enzyme family protein [Microlunatus sp. Gsoil 973]